MFALRYRNSKLMRKAFFRLRKKAFEKSDIAWKLAKVRVMKNCFNAIRKIGWKSVQERKINAQMDDIYKLF